MRFAITQVLLVLGEKLTSFASQAEHWYDQSFRVVFAGRSRDISAMRFELICSKVHTPLLL